MWIMWKEILEAVFNAIRWLESKVRQLIQVGIVDYGRLEWEKVKILPTKWSNFKEQWCRNDVLGLMEEQGPTWKITCLTCMDFI